MDLEKIVNAIRCFIVEEANLEDASFLENDTDLFEAGLLDSLLAVSLVSFFEDELGCSIDMSELSEENFNSLNALSSLIHGKLMHVSSQ